MTLRNAHLVSRADGLDGTLRSSLVAVQKLGPDRYRQVIDIHVSRRDGSTVEAVTISETSDEECSMGEVQVLVVERRIE